MSLHSGLDFFISKNARLGGKTDVASMKDSAAAIWPRVEISLSLVTLKLQVRQVTIINTNNKQTSKTL